MVGPLPQDGAQKAAEPLAVNTTGTYHRIELAGLPWATDGARSGMRKKSVHSSQISARAQVANPDKNDQLTQQAPHISSCQPSSQHTRCDGHTDA